MREEARDGYAGEHVLLEPGEAPELDVYHLPDFQRQSREERGGFLRVGRGCEGIPVWVFPLTSLERRLRDYVTERRHVPELTICPDVVMPTDGSSLICK